MGRNDAMNRRGALAYLTRVGSLPLVAARAATARAAAATVMIGNFRFAPTPLSVTPGTTVTWVNRDDMPHSVVCPAAGVRSPPLDTDDRFAFRFDQPGTYDYVCGLHPFMHGQVIVRG